MPEPSKPATCARCGEPADPPVATQLPQGPAVLCLECSKLSLTDREKFWDGFRERGGTGG